MAIEEGSVTAGAHRIGMTQATLSRRIQKLEQRLGFPLFDRQTRRLELTPGGRAFAEYARVATVAFKEARRAVEAAARLIDGELRIAASSAPGDFLLPGWLQRFLIEYPGCSPRLFVSDSNTVIQEILEGAWDIGFISSKPEGQSLRYHAVADDEVVLAVPLSHVFAGRRDIELKELAGQSFIDRVDGSATTKLVEDTLAARGLRLPERRKVMTVNSTHAISIAVAQGLGLCWASSRAFGRSQTAGLAAVRIAGFEFGRKLYMIQGRRPSPAVAETFASWLLEDLGGHPLSMPDASGMEPVSVK